MSEARLRGIRVFEEICSETDMSMQIVGFKKGF